MKRYLIGLMLLGFWSGVQAQLNNEWIDYNKTHYKFKVAADGLFRINFATLQQAGLANVPMEQFQLFRNGQEVSIFTSKASGLAGSTDYLEFYGKMNDGRQDTKFYRQAQQQPDNTWSLLTDSTTYFLTVTNSGNAFRLRNVPNNVTGTTLPPEPYFIYTFVKSYRDRLNLGFAAVTSQAYVYSSSFDQGEGWSSRDIYPSSPIAETFNLFPYAGGPNAVMSFGFSGNAPNGRIASVAVNGIEVINETTSSFAAVTRQVAIPVSNLGRSGGDAITIRNNSSVGSDRMVVSNIKIAYPRAFNFGGARQFEFSLSPAPAGNYLEISNFNHGGQAPILLDLTNQSRYVGELSNGMVKFALQPSTTPRQLVLLNYEAGSIRTVSRLEPRFFVDYSKAENQGDYLIISNSRLSNGSAGDAVENYRSYRSSAPGGSYKARIYDVTQLIDQFGFGIAGNGLAIKNFVQMTRLRYSVKPRFVFLIGRGLQYDDVRRMETFPITQELNLVPTFGVPGSDNLMVSAGYDVNIDIPVGRLAAINGNEVELYLQKVRQLENIRTTVGNTFVDRAWMKNVVHAIGGGDPYLQSVIASYMNVNKNILQDTSVGARVYTFSKSSGVGAENLTSDQLSRLFEEGIGLLTYFGHSSTNTLEFNIDNPDTYNNAGKYPLFIVNGCLAGNIFVYDSLRARGGSPTLSERYNLARERGGIAFIASTHFGVVNYLNIYTNGFYSAYAREQYGQSIGNIHKGAFARMQQNVPVSDFYGRAHLEQLLLHGDPAVNMYGYPQPDFVIEDPMVRISPNPVTVADNYFQLDVRFANIGKAVSDSVRLTIQRQLPGGVNQELFNRKIRAPRYLDSLKMDVPINPLTEKGDNSIVVTIDGDQKIAEGSENNNQITRKFVIIEDELRPVYPYNYAVVNQSEVTFYASVSNPYAPLRSYIIEVDTTELFNSSWKRAATIQSPGGLLQFNVPGITYLDSSVYYWRTAPVPLSGNAYVWNSSSFVYVKNGTPGYGQSHYYQFKRNRSDRIQLAPDRRFYFSEKKRLLKIRTGLEPFYMGDALTVTIDENFVVNYGCRYGSLQIVVYDKVTLQPWRNSTQSNGLGRFNSWPPCIHNDFAFEFPYYDATYRKRAMDFIESIPTGSLISISNLGMRANTSFVNQWLGDTATLGAGKSLYHSLRQLGFTVIDSFVRNVPFLFVGRKGNPLAPLHMNIGKTITDYLETNMLVETSEVDGAMTSPWFGPVQQWNKLYWTGNSLPPPTDKYSIDVYGKDLLGTERKLVTISQPVDTTLSFIDAKAYPYLRLRMNVSDSANGTPFQLRHWLLSGVLPPEGAIQPVAATQTRDSVEIGESVPFELAFRNISPTAFDSLSMRMTVTNSSNVTTAFPLPRMKPIRQGDTVLFRYQFDTKKMGGNNTVFLYFNPDVEQPEQYMFNNFLYRSFYVKEDNYKPSLDVTFDGVRILNQDMVSSKPKIQIKLTDNSKFMMLDDTSLLRIKVRFPNNQVKDYRFDNDTIKFIPAVFSNGVKTNTASVEFSPLFMGDGEYELIVTGNDKSGNSSGVIEYKVLFSVVNKAMISNLLNYPNPFTSSTAFVFTLTGSEVPQNMRIQIMTITGKIVREITKDELGPIRIGRNITDFKWDGTDQYGQKLANGVYLYRVLTNLNGKGLEKLTIDGAVDERYGDRSTDKYFRAGYGKMYLMR